MSDWRDTTLGEVLNFQRGHDITRATQRDGTIPVVSSGGISSYHDTAAAKAPGVVIGRKGTLGKVFYLPEDYWPHDTTLWVQDFKGSHPRFVYYFMTQFDTTWLDAGSANPTLNRNHLHPLKVRWPSVPHQLAIAEVLGALDDKIAANTKRAAAAKNLAEAYFLDALRGASDESVLGDILALEYGKSLPASKRKPGNVDVYGSGGISGTHNEALCENPGVVVGRKGTAGAVHWSRRPFFPIDTTFYVVPRSAVISQIFSYFLLRTLRLDEMNNDSAVPGLNRNEAHASQIRVPSEDLLNAFTTTATVLFDLIASSESENELLAATRDTLLPQLMSGKLRVKDAEKVLEQAGV